MANVSGNNPWFQHWLPKEQAQLRLFCFPYAGGSASVFRTWSAAFPVEIEVVPIQMPGRANRLLETPFSDISVLTEALMPVLFPYLDKPFAFFGHSMGALISFELVRCLRRRGYPYEPVHLFVSAHDAPQVLNLDLPTYNLPDAEFLNELRRLNGTSEEILQSPDFLRWLLPSLRADFALSETYSYTEDKPLTCPITAFGGLQDEETSYYKLEAWCQQTCNTFTLRFFTGGHFFLHDEQKALLQVLYQLLLNDL